MPPLARVEGIGDVLSQSVLSALGDAGIRDVKQFLCAKRDALEHQLGLSASTIAATVRLIRADCDKRNRADASGLRTALEIVHQRHTSNVRSGEWWLSSGCDGVDAVLDGGFKAGEVTELAGAPASGKTQLCMFTTVVALTADATATAVYIDTGTAFSYERVEQMFEGSDRFAQARDSGMLPSHVSTRINLRRVFEIHDMLDVLQEILQSKSGKVTNLRVVILDSVSAPLTSLVYAGNYQGFALLQTLSRMLNTLASSLNVVVLTTNMSVSAYPTNPLSSFECTNIKPALGITWSYAPAVQLLLSVLPAKKKKRAEATTGEASLASERNNDRDCGGGWGNAGRGEVMHWQNARQEVFPLVRRLCEVVRSRRTAGYKWTYFYIGNEIVSPCVET